jgi:septal ring-binding cell division protein DamX
MRKRYFTGNRKLSELKILICLFGGWAFSVAAEKKSEDIDIVCYATPKQWVCAPESEKQKANEKAAELVEKYEKEAPSNIVIKTIDIPKFESAEPVKKDDFYSAILPREEVVNKDEVVEDAVETEQSATEPVAQSQKQPQNNYTPVDSNPYARLWSHQLIGVSTPQNAVKFVVSKKLRKEDVLIIKTTRVGMEWWVVLFGLYKDKQTGIENEVNLPTNLDKPWLRPLFNLDVLGFIEDF